MNVETAYKIINFYPPFVFAGIRLKEKNKERTRLVVQMKLNFMNRNIYGTHFGGSLYSMCDPFYVFIVASHLKKDYIIWDKSASIEFVKPGKGKVQAVFEISKEKLQEMKEKADAGTQKNFFFETVITNQNNEVVAKVRKEIYVRRKIKKITAVH